MKVVNRTIAFAVKAALLTAPGISLVYADDSPKLEEVLVYGQAETYRPTDQTTATGLRLKLIDTPQSISVVSAEMLKLYNVQSAYEAVDLIPGASQLGYGYGLMQLSIRGQKLNNGRINGISMRSEEFVDSAALERIEVVRGPATVLYGVSGAFGGELNQVLKKPKSDFHADVGFKGGDFNSQRYEGDITGSVPGTDKRLQVRLIAAYGESGIFQETVVPSHNHNWLGSGALTYDFSPHTTASLYVYKEKKKLDPTDGCPLALDANNRLYIPRSISPENLYCNDPKHSNAEYENDFQFGTLSHTFDNDFRLEATFARSSFARTTDYTYGFGPAGAFGLADTDVYVYSYKDVEEGKTLTSRLTFDGKFSLFDKTQRFLLALEDQKQDLDRPSFVSFGLGVMNMFRDGGKGILNDGSPIPVVPDYGPSTGTRSSEVKSLRGSAQVLLNPVNRLDILAGVLMERSDQTSRGSGVTNTTTFAEQKETHTVDRLGLTYGLMATKGKRLTDAKAYFSYAEGFRPNVGVFGEGNVPLTDPQKMKSYEIGLKSQWMAGNVDASLALYSSTVTNVPTSYFLQGGGFVSVLQGEQKFKGLELEVIGEILPGWNASLTYTQTDNELGQLLFPVKLAVANVPEKQTSLFTSYEFLRGPLKGFIIGGGVVDKQNVPLVDAALTMYKNGWDPTNQVPWSATRVDFRASYKGFTGSLKGLDLSANIYNAFNARSFFSTDVPGTPSFGNTVGPPRTLSFAARYGF